MSIAPERTNRHAPRRQQHWTPAEDAVLLGAPAGADRRALAVQLGRTTPAVSTRLTLLRQRGRTADG